jgi:hypothetical protein
LTVLSLFFWSDIAAGPYVQPQYGDEVSPEQAPEAIAKVVAATAPEQLYELMKEMKDSIAVSSHP